MRRWILFLACLWLPYSLTATSVRAPNERVAENLLLAYNERDTGASGVRRIRLELRNDGVLTRDYEVIHTWQSEEATIRSLVLLEKPDNLRGTSYLLAEGESFIGGMQVYLALIAGKRRALEIKSGRFDEGLLGSDFSYSDLLWTLPLKGRKLESAGRTQLLGEDVWAVNVYPETEEAKASTVWGGVRYYLRDDPALLIGSDYYESATDLATKEPTKSLRIEGWHQQDGIWTPTKMEMSLGAARKSVLTLSRSSFHLPRFDPASFSPTTLTSHVDRLQEGSVPPFLASYVSPP